MIGLRCGRLRLRRGALGFTLGLLGGLALGAFGRFAFPGLSVSSQASKIMCSQGMTCSIDGNWPGGPASPRGPCGPALPSGPGAPGSPRGPFGPALPCGPGLPRGPSGPGRPG